MTKREWKYLRERVMRRLGYYSYSFKSYTYDRFDLPVAKEPIGPFSNFALMIPQQAIKISEWRPPMRTRTQVRFNLPIGITSIK